jgi:hypothetical protein
MRILATKSFKYVNMGNEQKTFNLIHVQVGWVSSHFSLDQQWYLNYRLEVLFHLGLQTF